MDTYTYTHLYIIHFNRSCIYIASSIGRYYEMRSCTAVRTHRYGTGIDVSGAYEAMIKYLSLPRNYIYCALIFSCFFFCVKSLGSASFMWMCLASYEVLSTLQTAGTICTSTVDRNLSVLEGEKWYFFNAVRQFFFLHSPCLFQICKKHLQVKMCITGIYLRYLRSLSSMHLCLN